MLRQILGAIRAVATAWKGAEILLLFFVMQLKHDVTDFPSDKIDKFYDICDTIRYIYVRSKANKMASLV